MKNQLFREYKTKYGLSSMISTKALFCYWFSLVFIFIDLGFLICSCILLPKLFLKIVILIIGIGLVPMTVLLYRRVLIRQVNKKYNTSISTKFWSFNSDGVASELSKQKKEKMKKYLIKYHLYRPEKLEQLIEAYQKDAENLKLSIAPAPAIFAALFIPLWSSFVDWQFDKISTVDESVFALLIGLGLSITVTAVLMVLHTGVWTPVEEWITSERQKYLALCRLLETIKMDIELRD